MMALCTHIQVIFAETYSIKPFAALPTANAKGLKRLTAYVGKKQIKHKKFCADLFSL